jgi:hypothetical protein
MICVSALCSCTANHRKQIFVSGDFTGTNKYDETDTFSFSVGVISENEFGEMAGDDVVKDEVGGGYYKLVFSMRKEGDSELDGAIYSITFHSGSSGADLDVFTYLYLEDK